MAKRGIRARTGDVFRVPISHQECGFGQILAKHERAVLLMAVFSARANNEVTPPLDQIVTSKPIFICNSLDALIWHGNWPIIGNLVPDLACFPLPTYKVQIRGQMCVETFDATRARPATESELSVLRFRSVVAPIILEDALKAYYGLAGWDDSLDDLTAEVALRSAAIRV